MMIQGSNKVIIIYWCVPRWQLATPPIEVIFIEKGQTWSGHRDGELSGSLTIYSVCLTLGFLRILINALSMIILQWTQVLHSLTIVRTIIGTCTNHQSQRIQLSSTHVVNVLSKINFHIFSCKRSSSISYFCVSSSMPSKYIVMLFLVLSLCHF